MLSNALFRLDAGTLAAYLVGAETAERHPTLSNGHRDYDIDLACERVGGGLLDLQVGELLPADIDPIEVADSLPPRYVALWDEVTREEVLAQDEQRYRVVERLQRLNDLGFDVGEVELVTLPGGRAKVRVETRASEPGLRPADRSHPDSRRAAGGGGPGRGDRWHESCHRLVGGQPRRCRASRPAARRSVAHPAW